MARVYLSSGQCKEQLPPELHPTEEGSAHFAKIAGTACGTVGVFTYNLFREATGQENKKMAIMFHVPFNYHFYSNWYAMGVFDIETSCDSQLYNEMYYNENEKFLRFQANTKRETYRYDDVAIKCKMTNCCEPTLIINIIE